MIMTNNGLMAAVRLALGTEEKSTWLYKWLRVAPVEAGLVRLSTSDRHYKKMGL